jgi:hypothetical protein
MIARLLPYLFKLYPIEKAMRNDRDKNPVADTAATTSNVFRNGAGSGDENSTVR